MVKIFPFEGILYNTDLKKVNNVFTPPYDVISPEEQDAYYNLHEFNFVKIALSKEFPGDNEYNNKYIRSAATLEGWLRHKILLKDKKPAIYVYEQKFTVRGKNYSRLGFTCLLRLEDMGRGKVFPHEETHSQAKMDRLKLMRATSANIEPIFSLYSDEKGKVNKVLKKFMGKKPVFDVKDKNKVQHRLWKIDSKPSIEKIVKEMKDKAAFIADGHHRYEAALRFKNELKMNNTKFTEEEEYNHIMMYFTSIEDKGLAIFPINRVIHNLAFFNPVEFLKSLEQFFDIEEFKASKKTVMAVRKKLAKDLEKAGQTKHAFGLYLGNNHYYLITLKDEKTVDEMVEEEKPKAWKRLDTTILHYVVFDRILGIARQIPDKVSYTKSAKSEDQVFEMVDKQGYQIAFLLNPTKIEEIVAIASKLEKMPQKSTFFYPKLLSGLVLNKIVHGEKIGL
ncbi:hypothetical protein A2291_02220 [candidate division WOR-1 bacterium RIFOXYB2_FULL_42_35]|uniref:DUF1015 domain-containing protein n=1 Tax=candidate division WOR-1 bacterium RIFOXYC2_FULL_41_25 TaxID=1802586 RepID=A0A1F4TSI7_UNCSA|nr:MAG: hypothetical protein A2247_02105 [candidate division WOR-1 bacterium RIFOXYA2_FULL_41_14]OGC24846.1 MAG: hypothetical protein A2291_02220 [candidate division WOR-1 bacterium RIFOXYB2_FULL_42_35]OGC35033.1 MAG: hypothetical protein A2462_05840 [candidate division WOR-1 bacterium RIFOXYC2_FULL_41_25]OGC43645.1 MAG: hypothetical protein A2548_07420 [candidate division WOR-1 bacterium RIFOXYD2_FULL_41_8]